MLGTSYLIRKIQPGELMLAEFNVMGLVVNGGIEARLAVAVAVKITETDVPRVGYFDGPREWLEGTDDAVAVEIGEGNIVGRIIFNRQGKAAFAPFFLGLQGIKAPVSGIRSEE